MKTFQRITSSFITTLTDNEIFVFGSNIHGMHGGGAARLALKWGAIMGQGIGLQGKTYAIPTMFGTIAEIKPYVDEFICFARQHPNYHFLVTEIGCGIAGYTPEEIGPLFAQAITEDIQNIWLPESFAEVITESNKR